MAATASVKKTSLSALTSPTSPFSNDCCLRPSSSLSGTDPDRYALRHQSLRDLLEGRLPATTDDAPLHDLAHDLGTATHGAHTRIVTTLVPTGDAASRDWGGIDDYTRAHIAEHAALAARLDELVLDPEFLLLSGAPELLRLRRHLSSDAGTAAVAALELASSFWRENHDDRSRWLEVSARKVDATLSQTRSQLGSTYPGPAAQPSGPAAATGC